MADENVPAPAPTRSDEQLLPFAAWVPIGKSNFVLDLHKKQKNPIFQIFVDILQNTNFFKAFIASASVPAIYIQYPTKKGRKDKPHLVDKPDEEPAHSEPKPKPEHQGEGKEFDMECAIQMSLELFQAQSQAHVGGVAIREPIAEASRPLPVVEGNATEGASTRSFAQPKDDTSANIVRDSPSLADAETGAELEKSNSEGDTEMVKITKELGEDVDKQENIEEKTMKLDQDQAASVTNPEPTHDEFMANLYPKVQESLKFLADEHVILDDPLKKLNVEAKVVSMVTVPIYQASSLVPPLSILVIDLSPPKPASSNTQASIFTATITTITKTLPLSPPPPQQSITESELAVRVTSLEQKFDAFEQKRKNLDNTTWNLRSRVFTLELRDLPHKIGEAVRENVKEAIQIALQAPLRDRFRDLPKADMKEMLHERMLETGSHKSLPKHIALYEALEASMKRAQR
ncbi:hypothetical protein Tco_0982322, partial [Tanacetum coccineum]